MCQVIDVVGSTSVFVRASYIHLQLNFQVFGAIERGSLDASPYTLENVGFWGANRHNASASDDLCILPMII